ncbi:outer membrane protein [Candidatus Magnetaquicoccus inordinatus]|uniref:outer membrane protein n=1 Tax=Candidatus Magnetaquicoccus inordinatus TaxID=2496818 RepID=UPI00102BE402|nr:acyloxyacyl hydrolase [Candidatus Magnetaquicoccus inordinatus]
MKRLMLLAGIVALSVVATAAHTVEKPYYVSLKIGGAFADDTEGKTKVGAKATATGYEENATYSVAAGIRLHPSVRLELEGGYRKLYADSLSVRGAAVTKLNGAMTVKTVMGNAIYDLPLDSMLKPYLLGGIGLARTDSTVIYNAATSNKGYSTDFAFQLGAGVTFPLTDLVHADIGYRYLHLSGADMGHVISTEDNSIHEIYAGVQMGF